MLDLLLLEDFPDAAEVGLASQTSLRESNFIGPKNDIQFNMKSREK